MNVSEIPVGYNILKCKKRSININIEILSAIYISQWLQTKNPNKQTKKIKWT